jgi:glucokinase
MLPDMVVLGGGLVEAMPDIFVETVESSAKDTVMPPFAKLFNVAAAKLGDDSTVLGAAAWAAECLSTDVETSLTAEAT